VTTPLRTLLIGDTDYYPSEFIVGVAQGMTLLGHWHTSVNIRASWDIVQKRIREVRPDVIWGHMLLWPPGGPSSRDVLLDLVEGAKTTYGTQVLIHDGDAREQTRYPEPIDRFVDVALCNHTYPRSEWRVPARRWPYFAFHQK